MKSNLILVIVPPPQSAEHVPVSLQAPHSPVIHELVAHLLVSDDGPKQSVGDELCSFIQILVLKVIPPPHVTKHLLNSVHSDHLLHVCNLHSKVRVDSPSHWPGWLQNLNG